MMGKKCDYLIAKRNFLLLSTEEKIYVLNNLEKYNLNTRDKVILIKNLPADVRADKLIIIFKYNILYGITDEELIVIFKELNYDDKMFILENVDDFDKRILLSELSHKEYYKILRYRPLWSDFQLRDFIIEKLSIEERVMLFNKLPVRECASEKRSLLKWLPEKYTINFLEKNKREYSYDVRKLCERIICFLNNDKEKIECLSTPNKYNVELAFNQKMEVIYSLSDEEKLKFIKFRGNHPDGFVFLNDMNIYSIAGTLSDEVLLNLLSNDEIIRTYFDGNIIELVSVMTSSACKKLLLERNKYQFLNDQNILREVIVRLSLEEKKLLLSKNNKYNIVLDNWEIVDLIKTFPDKIKLQIISEQQMNLSKNDIKNIILSLETSKIIISLLVNNDLLSETDIIDMISRRTKYNDLKLLLKCHNKEVKDFVNKYRKKIITSLNIDEQIDILKNPDKYVLKLTDEEKILMMVSQSKAGYERINFNILSCFENKEYFYNCFFNNFVDFTCIDVKYQKKLIIKYMKSKKLHADVDVVYMILKYNNNATNIFEKFSELSQLFKVLNIDFSDFLQYGINSHRENYLEIILTIIDNCEILVFRKIKDYFFNKYYYVTKNPRMIIQQFLEVLSLYYNYPELCVFLVDNGIELSKDEQEGLNFLVSRDEVIANIKTLDDLLTYRKKIVNKYHDKLIDDDECSQIIERLCRLLFMKSRQDVEKLLKMTGSLEDLEILKFNNRYNKGFATVCDDLIVVVDLMEQIITIKDKEVAKRLLVYFTNDQNHDHTMRIANYCMKYEDNVRRLYELDFQLSLTKIDELPEVMSQTIEAIKLRKLYGGKVIDLSNSNYVLAAHVISYREKIENLLNGVSDGEQNFISLSAISHRGQQYYCMDFSNIILAYDTIPENSFICSSNKNLGSNGDLICHTLEVPNFNRCQKGVLETSQCGENQNQNSEILLYRSNLRPCGIIIPKNATPTIEEIKYHKKYKLPFIITQEVRETIKNPKRIEREKTVPLDVITDADELCELQRLRNELVSLHHNNGDCFAVLADPHALYEPTLACLLDIHKQGITEIYSLGDNIGHGPSPRETLELLNRFNVQSVYGNHELYLQDNAIEEFRNHFPSEESLMRTKMMVKWIRHELTERQLEKIKSYPERYEINVEGKNPLTLIHTTKAYTSDGKYSVKPVIKENNYVIQGHDHFASNDGDKNITLRGVGIGQDDRHDGEAAYIIVEINNGKYEIKTKYVTYNRNNLLHTINESTMPETAKCLIKRWVDNRH